MTTRAKLCSVFVLVAGFRLCAGSAFAQPASWPVIDTPLGSDPAESGCADHRDVTGAFFATDASYFYLRLETLADAGWPGISGSPSEARYKWWFDTGGTTASINGTSVNDAEFLIAVEDLTDNANDPNEPRDQLGEMTLMDDLANDGFTARWGSHSVYLVNSPDTSPSPSGLWRRTLGAGTPGVGGPQQAMSNADVGFRIAGNVVDIYVSRAAVGNPTNACVIWAADIQATNLDQAPNCDRPASPMCLEVVEDTPTPTASTTPTPTQTASATATASASSTATPTASVTATASPSATQTADDTATATASATASPSPTQTAEDTATETATPSATQTADDTATATATVTETATATATVTETPTDTPTPADSPTASPTSTETDTSTPTPTATETATATASQTATNTPSPTPTNTVRTVQCSFAPRGNCRTPRKSLLLLQDKSPDRKDMVKWKWLKGAATSMKDPAEFGDPLATASYSLCIYHGGVLLEELYVPAGGTCGSKPCWKPLRNHLQPPPKILRAYKYRDKNRQADGVLKVLLRGGAEGKARVIFKARGPNVPDPGLGLNEPVLVELINSETPVCWSDTYSGAAVFRNDPLQFKGKRR